VPRIPSRARAARILAPRLLALYALPLAACSSQADPTAPIGAAITPWPMQVVASSKGDRLATIEMEENREVLYLQNADGSDRVRVHFKNVHDHVAGNYPPSMLPVTDETIRAIRRAKWSPDGQQLAVIVVPGNDVAEVVLVSADGHDIRTVSPNGQYLVGDMDWSPDSRRIAYTMTTGPFASLPDLFVTELGPDQVRRLTASGKVSGFDTFRFGLDGERIHFTEHLGLAPDGVNTFVAAVVDRPDDGSDRGSRDSCRRAPGYCARRVVGAPDPLGGRTSARARSRLVWHRSGDGARERRPAARRAARW
jgi:dipeptidyl aminopeptidase/acylaminoacyl peptidase